MKQPHAATRHTEPAEPVKEPKAEKLEKLAAVEKEPPVDHLGCIRELVGQLRNASPSGANTIADQITAHLDAHAKA